MKTCAEIYVAFFYINTHILRHSEDIQRSGGVGAIKMKLRVKYFVFAERGESSLWAIVRNFFLYQNHIADYYAVYTQHMRIESSHSTKNAFFTHLCKVN